MMEFERIYEQIQKQFPGASILQSTNVTNNICKIVVDDLRARAGKHVNLNCSYKYGGCSEASDLLNEIAGEYDPKHEAQDELSLR